jgi:hypothetical protein
MVLIPLLDFRRASCYDENRDMRRVQDYSQASKEE